MTENERWERIERGIEHLLTISARHDAAIQKLIAVSNQDAGRIHALARIADIHEKRLAHLEGKE